MALILVSRLAEIAHIATLGAGGLKLLCFALYQIPYILPFALAISSLLASLLLMQHLSLHHELMALRVTGFSLRKILTPLLFAAIALSLITFYIASEVTTRCHLLSRKILYDITSTNPLFLLQNAKLAKLKGADISLHKANSGQKVVDVQIGLAGKQMMLFLAESLSLENGSLIGDNISLLTCGEGNIYIENSQKSVTKSENLVKILYGKGWKLSPDHLSWRLLRVRERSLRESSDPKAKRAIIKIQSEKAARISLALTPLTFTLLGISSGISIERRKKLSLLPLLALTSFSLFSFFMAKQLDILFPLSLLFSFLPHSLIGFFSMRRLGGLL